MKTKFTDALQVIAAILITGSLVASAAPLPPQQTNSAVETQTEQVKEPDSIEIAPETSAEPSKIAETPEKVVVWQDNPNHCTDAQYIAKEKPFKCIDKLTAGTSTPTDVKITGDRYDWLAKSGIPRANWWAVDYIVSHESGWNPCSYNPGQSNCSLTADEVNATQGVGVACGLGQSLPCGKWGADWTDPVNQLQHMDDYVQKYGGWAGAVAYWKSYGHY